MTTNEISKASSFAFGLFCTLNFIDFLITYFGLRLGLSENNPLVSAIPSGVFFLIKIGLISLAFVLYKEDNLHYYTFITLCNGALISIVLNNLILIIRVLN